MGSKVNRIEEVESLLLGDAHVVRIRLEDGTEGVGQSALWGYPEAVHAMFDRVRPALLGMDGWDRHRIASLVYRMGPFRGAALSAAVAAIDIALWDIAGKLTGVPVWQLLGGRVRDRVRLHLLLDGGDADSVVEQAQAAAEAGFTAVKFDPLPADSHDLTTPELVSHTVATVAAVRRSLPNMDIILEMHRKLTPGQALAVGQRLAEFDLMFWEDPIQIDTVSTQVEVGKAVPIPYGIGERFHTIWEFREVLAGGGVHYVRPDVGLAGGITHVRKIAAIAEAHHAALMLHNCLGPLLTAASMHLAVTTPNFATLEYSLMDERLHDFTVGGCVREGGYLLPPTEPGLGVELAPEPKPQVLVPRRTHEVPFRSDGSVAYDV